jgi:hypothetical protein
LLTTCPGTPVVGEAVPVLVADAFDVADVEVDGVAVVPRILPA